MPSILVQFADAIKGCFTAFDRMIFRGRIMPPCTDSGATGYALNGARVLFKDWKEYSEKTAREIIPHAEKTCAGLGRPFTSLDTQEERNRKKESKEARARECLGESPLPDGCGLVCVLSAVENGKVARLMGRGSGKPSPGLSNGKRKHLCYYFVHEKYGFMYAKAMAWLPFTMMMASFSQ